MFVGLSLCLSIRLLVCIWKEFKVIRCLKLFISRHKKYFSYTLNQDTSSRTHNRISKHCLLSRTKNWNKSKFLCQPDRDIYTGTDIETFPAHKSELKKLFPHSNIQLIICLPNQIVLMLSCGKTF